MVPSTYNPVDMMVVKTNILIEAAYRLTLIEQYLITLSICKLRKSGDIDKTIKISAKEFSLIFTEMDERSSYLQLKTAVSNLYNRSISGELEIEGGVKEQIKMRWIYKCVYIDDQGRVELNFSPEILPHFTRIDGKHLGYTQYNLNNINRMTSPITIRVYELLKKDAFKGNSIIEIQSLRTTLKIESHEYPRMTDFKRRIVEPACNQINQMTDLQVSYSNVKHGKEVVALSFKIDKKTKVLPPPKAVEANDLTKRIVALGVSAETANEHIEKYGEERVAGNLIIVEQRIAAAAAGLRKSIKDYASYLAKAIKIDWRKSEADVDKKKREEKEAREAKAREENNKRTAAAAESKKRLTAVQSAYDKMSTAAQEDAKTGFIKAMQNLNNGHILKAYTRNGFSSPVVNTEFLKWMPQ